MKKTATLSFLALMMAYLPAVSEDVKRTTALEFTASLFSAAAPVQAVPKESGRPEVFLVAKIHGLGLGKNTALQKENLSRLFNLPDLELVDDAAETEIAWESGTWPEYRKSLPRAVQTVRLDGEDYSVYLIPHKIDVANKIFKFILEIYRSKGSGGVETLKSAERIVHREILWDFGGPLAVGLYFPDRIYFMSWTIGIDLSTIGFRFGSGLAWIL